MDTTPSAVLTEGFGSWGTVNLMVTLGYGIGAAQSEGGSVRATPGGANRVSATAGSSARVAVTPSGTNRAAGTAGGL